MISGVKVLRQVGGHWAAEAAADGQQLAAGGRDCLGRRTTGGRAVGGQVTGGGGGQAVGGWREVCGLAAPSDS